VKSGKKKRALGMDHVVAKADAKGIKKLLGK
jgi:ribosomal protein L35